MLTEDEVISAELRAPETSNSSNMNSTSHAQDNEQVFMHAH
jgi:hypothetical protein